MILIIILIIYYICKVCFCGYGCFGLIFSCLLCLFFEFFCGKFFENGVEIVRMWGSWILDFCYLVSK